MRFHEFGPKTYEVIVTAPQTVEIPGMYNSVAEDGEELLHIPIEAEEKIAKRRRMYLLAFHAAMKTMELQNIPPSEEPRLDLIDNGICDR